MKPVAIDLFCGLGGWTDALMEAGFTVYGFDINPQPKYKGIFVQADILQMTADDLRAYNPAFVTCSSPCEEFSVHGMKHFHPNPKYPVMGIRLFEHSRSMLEELGVPYVMENVRPTEKFVGKAVNHCGPFYLWGTGVPAIFPKDAYRVSKGIDMGSSLATKGMSREAITAYRRQFDTMWASSKSPERKAATAKAAQIPKTIASTVARLAKNLVEVAA